MDLPENVPESYTLQDVAVFSKGYIENYPVFIRNTDDETLSDGRPVSLSISGELFEVAESVNKASRIISSQNQARASWISGVSHDIRTPLSMIMGYARRITCDSEATTCIKDQAEIIRMQSIKIKELVQDLNLVSQLEYEMQPLNKKVIRISKLLRSYVAELLNTGIPNTHSIDIEIMPGAEIITLEGDERLLSRAINNLVQNSIHHNPQGCEVTLLLDCSENTFSIIVKDNGIGLSPEKLQELENKPHYMESVDDRLDLRHGLGLLLVRQIVDVHGGTMQLESKPQKGYQTKLIFPIKNNFKASK